MSAKDYFIRTQFLGFMGNILVFPNNACVINYKTDYVFGCNMTGQLWTLTIELMLYIFVGFFLSRNKMVNFKTLTIVITFCLALFVRTNWTEISDIRIIIDEILLFQFLPARSLPLIAMFLVGGLLNKWDRIPKKIVGLSIILLVSSFKTPFLVLFEICFLPIIVIEIGRRPFRISNIYNKIGDLSYGIFLWGWPIQTIYWSVLDKQKNLFDCFLILFMSWIFGFLSHQLIEKPIRRLSNRTI
jgi:peptidoglycan/LPS O-acetylase OafA/YrhL